MAGFSDLVRQAQPALYADGVTASATAGRTWLFEFVDVTDSAGDPIDLTTAVGTCEVLDAPGGSVVATFDFIGADGSFTLSLDEADTAGLYSASDHRGRICYWNFVLFDGVDSVQVWDARNSKFTIHRGA